MYQVVDGVVVEEVSVGDSFDLASVRILTRHLSSPLKLPKSKTVDYYFQSQQSLIFPLRLVSRAQQEVVSMGGPIFTVVSLGRWLLLSSIIFVCP